jgi:two-component system sensor histidine kinase HydH
MAQQSKKYFNNIFILLATVVSAISSITVLVLAFMNHNREKQFMVEFLNDKGASLIRAFEAGTKMGMTGVFGALSRIEP